ncbi:redox-regulated ATPase YchF [Mycoplasmopsis pulmonis]|nr:redox-regulated ATPase YchF [Mycoplasmopsis pulmonis]MDZ7293132.1 redox-regulated ATPase YchF [Mycoplasmopsis pulmonis]VEU67929.1 GTP-binding and nucleic acid-binding protein YchF [Mycoplasmopsis pulmonis]
MSLKAGIVGLPNVGKSSLFSAITKKSVESANYAFTTIEPNIASVELIDKRLQKLAKLANSKKIIYATFDFVDIAGLVAGASKGEGLGNKFLANIREVDAIIHVVRCFENNDVLHVGGKIDPVFDAETINLELILADLQSVENILNRIKKRALSSNDATVKKEYELLNKIKEALSNQKLAISINLNQEEKDLIKSHQLLTMKPQIFVANIGLNDLDNLDKNQNYQKLLKFAQEQNFMTIPICIKIETELSSIENEEEKNEMMQAMNIEDSSINILARKAFELLDLETFFTVGKVEARAWVYKKNSLAPQCAGIIHSDFEKKFIKAEVISYKDFIEAGSEQNAKENGKMRLEGKNYLMQDGDICHFKFGK